MNVNDAKCIIHSKVKIIACTHIFLGYWLFFLQKHILMPYSALPYSYYIIAVVNFNIALNHLFL